MVIPLAKWQPDAYNLNSGFSSDVQGVFPGVNSKEPWPQLAAYGGALPATCRGGILARDSNGAYQLFAGTSTNLYKFNTSTLVWDDVTRSSGGNYSLPAEDRWHFAVFGDYVYATQVGDVLQRIDTASGTNFAAVSGSPPQARFIKVIGDQIWLSNTTTDQRQVFWSGRNNPTFWTAGGGQDCDFQTFPDGGFVNAVTGITSGFVFQEDRVRSFSPTNDRAIYNFVTVDDASGLLAPDSVVTFLGTTYYLGQDGFRSIGPDGSRRIGLETVNKWFLDQNPKPTRRALTSGVMDPRRPRILWAFTTADTGYTLDHILCYDISLDEWTHAAVDVEYLVSATTAGLTMEGLDADYPDLDAMTISLDSPFWNGGQPIISAFNTDHKLAFFSGSPMAAIIDSSEFQAVPGKRSMITGIRPFTNATNVTVKVGTRQKQTSDDMVSFRAARSLNGRGWAPARASGRYHTVRFQIAAGEDWDDIQGFEPDVSQEGKR